MRYFSKRSHWGLNGGGDKEKKKLRTDPTEMTRTLLHILTIPPHHPSSVDTMWHVEDWE